MTDERLAELEAQAEKLPLLLSDSNRAILLSNEIVIGLSEGTITGIGVAARLMELSKVVRAEEREACARMATQFSNTTGPACNGLDPNSCEFKTNPGRCGCFLRQQIATAIRARGPS